jgi:hypothetical protein
MCERCGEGGKAEALNEALAIMFLIGGGFFFAAALYRNWVSFAVGVVMWWFVIYVVKSEESRCRKKDDGK